MASRIRKGHAMTRSKKLILNTATSLLYQIVGIVCGFILPRILLETYGSAVNGAVSSITQFLGFITLCECGVGAVVQSALYKPLAENDTSEYSRIYRSSERFFRKIAWILVIYAAALMGVYPIIVLGEFDYFFTFFLVFVISISSFAQYYFGMTYRLFLSADQLGFIQLSLQSVLQIVNTVLSIVMMRSGASIHAVKLMTSLLFTLQPIVYTVAARKFYRIDRGIALTEEPLKQKWNGLAQHVASVVLGNADTVILTLFSTLENVSVYGIYHLVVNGVKQIVVSLTSGIQALLGNMLAKKEEKALLSAFSAFEWGMHTVVTIAFTVTGLLILPFVRVYTAGITDADYVVPTFAVLITLAQAAYCLRLPYNVMVLAAGHYKETQMSAIIEAVINVVLSILFVARFGLVGVAVGTLAAMAYRTVYLAWYLKKQILHRPISFFLMHLAVDVVIAGFSVGAVLLFPSLYTLGAITYGAWIVLAVKVGVTALLTSLLVNLLVYRKDCAAFARLVLTRLRRK